MEEVGPIPPANVRQALETCRKESLRSGSTFRHALRLFPGDTSLAMHTLYVFCRRVDDAVDDDHPDEHAHRLLNGLQAGLNNFPDQPLWRALEWVIDRWNLPQRWFDDLIVGARGDIGRVRIRDYVELQQYCYRVAGTVGLMSLHVMNSPDPALYPYSLSMARAFQLTNILRDVGEDRDRDRCYLPGEWLQNAGALSAWENRTMTPELRAVMRRVAFRARLNFRQSRLLFYRVPRRFRLPLSVMTACYGEYLRQLEAADFPAFEHRTGLRATSVGRIVRNLMLIPLNGYGSCLPTS